MAFPDFIYQEAASNSWTNFQRFVRLVRGQITSDNSVLPQKNCKPQRWSRTIVAWLPNYKKTAIHLPFIRPAVYKVVPRTKVPTYKNEAFQLFSDVWTVSFNLFTPRNSIAAQCSSTNICNCLRPQVLSRLSLRCTKTGKGLNGTQLQWNKTLINLMQFTKLSRKRLSRQSDAYLEAAARLTADQQPSKLLPRAVGPYKNTEIVSRSIMIGRARI